MLVVVSVAQVLNPIEIRMSVSVKHATRLVEESRLPGTLLCLLNFSNGYGRHNGSRSLSMTSHPMGLSSSPFQGLMELIMRDAWMTFMYKHTLEDHLQHFGDVLARINDVGADPKKCILCH